MAHSVSLLGREVDCETIGGYKFLFSPKTRQPLAVCFFGVGGIGPEIPETQEQRAKNVSIQGMRCRNSAFIPIFARRKINKNKIWQKNSKN